MCCGLKALRLLEARFATASFQGAARVFLRGELKKSESEVRSGDCFCTCFGDVGCGSMRGSLVHTHEVQIG